MTNDAWVQSSYCNSQGCVQWIKSSYSGAGGSECVERGLDLDQPQTVYVRDSKDRSGPVLSFSADAWRDFIASVKHGEMG